MAVTGGEVAQLHVDQDMSITVASLKAQMMWPWKKLSGGTIDQFYFASRVAIADLVTGGGTPCSWTTVLSKWTTSACSMLKLLLENWGEQTDYSPDLPAAGNRTACRHGSRGYCLINLEADRSDRVQVAISSACLYPQLLTETALVNIAAFGCKSVEIFLQTRREYRYPYVSRLARLCRNLGLSVHSLHAASAQYEPMVFYKYRRQNLDGYEILQEIHQGAAVLGAKCHVFHGPLKAENIAFSRLTEGLFQVAEAAASWGIKLALENVSWCAGWSPAVFRQLNTRTFPTSTIPLTASKRCAAV